MKALLLAGAVALFSGNLDARVVCERCPLPGAMADYVGEGYPPLYLWLLDPKTGDIWAYSADTPAEKPIKIGRIPKLGAPMQVEKPTARPPRSLGEAQKGLQDLLKAEQTFFGEWNTYSTDLVSIDWRPDGTPRYVYGFCNEYPTEPLPGIASYDAKRNTTSNEAVITDWRGLYSTRSMRVPDPCGTLETLGFEGAFRAEVARFRAFAIGNLDDDADFDIWSIDHLGTVKHVSKD